MMRLIPYLNIHVLQITTHPLCVQHASIRSYLAAHGSASEDCPHPVEHDPWLGQQTNYQSTTVCESKLIKAKSRLGQIVTKE